MRRFLSLVITILYLALSSVSAKAQCSSGCNISYTTCAPLGATTVASGTIGSYNVYCISPPAGCGVITVGNFTLSQYSTVRVCTSSPTDTVKFVGNFSASGGGGAAANDNTRRLEVYGNAQITFGGTVNFNSRLVINVASTGTLDLRPNPTGPSPFVIANSDSIINDGKILINGPVNFTGTLSNRGTLSTSGALSAMTFAAGATNTSTGVINTSYNITLGSGANLLNFGNITSQGSFTSSSGSFFANKNYWHALGNATFSGSYSNTAYFLSDHVLTLNASGTLSVVGGVFESDSLILNSGTLDATGGCAVFKVHRYSSIQSSGASGTPVGAVGILDMNNPGQIDNVACGCGSTDADQIDNSITPPSGTQCSVAAAPNATGPYCGIKPISSYTGGSSCVVSLPVEFVSITVQPTTMGDIINWTVNENTKNLRYEVEYSNDGNAYSSAGTIVPAKVDQLSNYTFTYNNYTSIGLYYRIKQTDVDGRIYYSTTVYSDQANRPSMYLFPNPATDRVTIYGDASLNSVELLSADGQLINTYNIKESSSIDVSQFNRGVYFVRFSFNNSISYSKLIIQ